MVFDLSADSIDPSVIFWYCQILDRGSRAGGYLGLHCCHQLGEHVAPKVAQLGVFNDVIALHDAV